MVFNATFNNISLISWQSVLLVEETGVPGENHWPATSHWKALSHKVVLSRHLLSVICTTLVVIGTDCTGSCIQLLYNHDSPYLYCMYLAWTSEPLPWVCISVGGSIVVNKTSGTFFFLKQKWYRVQICLMTGVTWWVIQKPVFQPCNTLFFCEFELGLNIFYLLKILLIGNGHKLSKQLFKAYSLQFTTNYIHFSNHTMKCINLHKDV